MNNAKVLLRSRLNVGFNLNVLVFYCKLCAFRIDFFTSHIFNFFFFETRLNDLFSSTGFYFKGKVIEGSNKKKNKFLNLWALFLKIFIFENVTFFSRLVIQLTQFFSGSTY